MMRLNHSIDSNADRNASTAAAAAEQRGDFGLLLLEEDPRVEVLVDLLQVGGVAGVEVFARVRFAMVLSDSSSRRTRIDQPSAPMISPLAVPTPTV